jgi:Uma2 family endonuclease
MAMPVVVPRYTIQDLESFPDDGNRYELLDGVLLVTPAPAPFHQAVVAQLFHILSNYVAGSGLARVFSPGAVEVQPRVHLEPDVLVVPATELAQGLDSSTRWSDIRKWWLAVEVSGSGSLYYDRDHKTPAYLAVGVREVWRVDLQDQLVVVARPGADDILVRDRIVWHPPELPEPLRISVPNLFLEARR